LAGPIPTQRTQYGRLGWAHDAFFRPCGPIATYVSEFSRGGRLYLLLPGLSGAQMGNERKLQGRPMWHSLRHGAATFIIVACIGLVAAAQVGRDRRGGESTDASAMEETTGSIGENTRATELALSDEERGRIYEGRPAVAAGRRAWPTCGGSARWLPA